MVTRQFAVMIVQRGYVVATMPRLYDDPQFQEYHPSSDGLANRE